MLPKSIYIKIPSGFSEVRKVNKDQVLKIRRALYGLRQSGLLWYKHLKEILIREGLRPSIYGPSIFVSKLEGSCLAVAVYVDDLLIQGKEKYVDAFIKQLQVECPLKRTDLDDFLGFQISRLGGPTGSIEINLSKYIATTVQDFKIPVLAESKTPMATSLDLYKEKDQGESKEFQRLLGKLIWITRMRPDIAFPVSYLSRFASKFSKKAMEAGLKILKYLKHTRFYKLEYNKMLEPDQKIWGHADSSFSDHSTNRVSQGGAAIFYVKNLILHYSKKQSLVATSTYEAELFELVRATKEIISILGMC